MTAETQIKDTLMALGVTALYKGYDRTAYAICLIADDKSRLRGIRQNVYTPTAEYFNCSVGAVERSIRTAIARAWEVDSEALVKMSVYPLHNEPSAAQFLDILANYITSK